MNNIETMKLALEALDDRASLMKWQSARESLRQAIEQTQKQEPVAWLQFKDNEPPVVVPRNLGTPVFLGIQSGLAHDAGEKP